MTAVLQIGVGVLGRPVLTVAMLVLAVARWRRERAGRVVPMEA